jgi:hypothetical protein
LDRAGDNHIFEIPPSPRWATVAKDIETFEPTKVQALNDGDEVLRVFVREVPASAPANEAPLPAVVSDDPETVRLTHFANLLARAYENGNEFMSKVTELLIQRSDRTEERLERVEAAWRSEFTARVQEKLDGVEDEDMRGEMAKLFFGGMTGKGPGAEPSQPSAPTNGAPRMPRGWGGN